MKTSKKDQEPMCPWCGNKMTLVYLELQYPPDTKNRYECLRCGANAPNGTSPEDAYKKAMRRFPSVP